MACFVWRKVRDLVFTAASLYLYIYLCLCLCSALL